MVALSSFSARHPNKRPTHPVDLSNAPKKSKHSRIRSSTPGASYDRIIGPPSTKRASRRRLRSTQGNASYDRIVRPERKKTAAKQTRPETKARWFSSYRVQTQLRIGMTISFFR